MTISFVRMEDYLVLGRVGEGAHGIVMKCRHKISGQVVALKKVPLKRLEDGISEATIREIKALQQLESQFVVKLYDVFPQGMGFVLVFEFMVSDLSEVIKDAQNPLSQEEVKGYMLMLLRGVAFLHEREVMHRDLKPANLLISAEGRLKIADFGLSRICRRGEERQYSHQVATRWYRAPELLYGSRDYTEGVDLWAVGCILGELLNHCPLFPGENDIDQLGIVIRNLGSPTEQSWPGVGNLPDYSKITFPDTSGIAYTDMVPEATPGAVNLLSNLVIYDSSKRLPAKKALKHPFFYELPFPARVDEMRKPGEKRLGLPSKDYPTDLPFHKHFENLLSLVD